MTYDKIEAGRKLGLSNKGKSHLTGNNFFGGHKHSEKTKKKFSSQRKGKGNSNWKGGKKIHRSYICIHMPKHTNADSHGYVKEHRLVVEKFIGRYLSKEEVVHHINEIKDDNRIENLMLFKTNAEHIKFHTKIRQFGMTTPIIKQIKNRWK